TVVRTLAAFQGLSSATGAVTSSQAAFPRSCPNATAADRPDQHLGPRRRGSEDGLEAAPGVCGERPLERALRGPKAVERSQCDRNRQLATRTRRERPAQG